MPRVDHNQACDAGPYTAQLVYVSAGCLFSFLPPFTDHVRDSDFPQKKKNVRDSDPS
jgi:hypothetical protein